MGRTPHLVGPAGSQDLLGPIRTAHINRIHECETRTASCGTTRTERAGQETRSDRFLSIFHPGTYVLRWAVRMANFSQRSRRYGNIFCHDVITKTASDNFVRLANISFYRILVRIHTYVEKSMRPVASVKKQPTAVKICMRFACRHFHEHGIKTLMQRLF